MAGRAPPKTEDRYMQLEIEIKAEDGRSVVIPRGEVDLVTSTKVGRARECRLGPAQLQLAMDWIDEYQRIWRRRLDRFGDYVEAGEADR